MQVRQQQGRRAVKFALLAALAALQRLGAEHAAERPSQGTGVGEWLGGACQAHAHHPLAALTPNLIALRETHPQAAAEQRRKLCPALRQQSLAVAVQLPSHMADTVRQRASSQSQLHLHYN